MDPTDEPGITEASARYLVAAFQLWASHGHRVSTGAIARWLSVEPSSVTEMFGKLDAAGYLDHSPHNGVEPTPRGTELARALSRRQCLVEDFFEDVGAPIGAERAHAVGCRLSEDAVDRLGVASDHACLDGCRAGQARLEECSKLSGAEVA